MPVFHAPETAYAKELTKWEAYPTPAGPPGRPFVFREYPMMLYRIIEENPLSYESHQVDTEQERRNMESRGFYAGGPGAALDGFRAEQQNVAILAAARAAEELKMSDAARAEALAYEQSVDGHVAEIPEMPIRRRPGRPPAVKE